MANNEVTLSSGSFSYISGTKISLHWTLFIIFLPLFPILLFIVNKFFRGLVFAELPSEDFSTEYYTRAWVSAQNWSWTRHVFSHVCNIGHVGRISVCWSQGLSRPERGAHSNRALVLNPFKEARLTGRFQNLADGKQFLWGRSTVTSCECRIIWIHNNKLWINNQGNETSKHEKDVANHALYFGVKNEGKPRYLKLLTEDNF